jgi:hypothetical protein
MLDKTLRALVIDPDPRALADAAGVLAGRGFRVAGRTAPDDALEYVRRARPNVVLLGETFWKDGWGAEIRNAAPGTVVVPLDRRPETAVVA